jgi:hypothetical protein
MFSLPVRCLRLSVCGPEDWRLRSRSPRSWASGARPGARWDGSSGRASSSTSPRAFWRARSRDSCRRRHSSFLNDLKVPVKIAQEQLDHASDLVSGIQLALFGPRRKHPKLL